MITRRQVLLLAVLLLVSPVLGVYLAELVGYHEPLDIAAELLGLEERGGDFYQTPFRDYTVPGLPAALGYIAAGAIGVTLILAVGYAVLLLSKRGRARCGGR